MADMRTAVIRINIDPDGHLSDELLRAGVAVLTDRLDPDDIRLLDPRLDTLPPTGRELEFLSEGTDTAAIQAAVSELCADAFSTTPAPGVVTFVSRGTDEDVHGVLAGFGLTGSVTRVTGDEGFDIITVTLPQSALERVPESRVHTALEASTNCEIRILTR